MAGVVNVGVGPGAPRAPDSDLPELCDVLAHMSAVTGQDYSAYRPELLRARVERRMRLQQIGELATYARFLHSDPTEVDALRRAWALGATSFFRDPQELGAAACRVAGLVGARRDGRAL